MARASARIAPWLVAAVVLFDRTATGAEGFELESDLSASPEFVYATNDARRPFLDGQVVIGAGLSTISNYRLTRFGARASATLEEDHFSAGLLASYSPAQAARSSFFVDPHAAFTVERGRVTLATVLGLTLRHLSTPLLGEVLAGTPSTAAASAARSAAPVAMATPMATIDQAQLHAEIELRVAGVGQLVLVAMGSFYDPPLARLAQRGADLGAAITVADRPELVAGGARIGRALNEVVLVELGLIGTRYADGHGDALVPRASLRLGAFAGVSVEASLELVVGIGAARGDPIRPIGGLNLQVER